MPHGISEPSLTPPEPAIIAHCTECMGEIYEGNRWFLIGGKVYCKACIDASEQID